MTIFNSKLFVYQRVDCPIMSNVRLWSNIGHPGAPMTRDLCRPFLGTWTIHVLGVNNSKSFPQWCFSSPKTTYVNYHLPNIVDRSFVPVDFFCVGLVVFTRNDSIYEWNTSHLQVKQSVRNPWPKFPLDEAWFWHKKRRHLWRRHVYWWIECFSRFLFPDNYPE